MLLGLSWQYRAEGNHHVVFAPATPGRDVVLRVVKAMADAAPLEDEARRRRCCGGARAPASSLEREERYARRVVAPLLGRAYMPCGRVVALRPAVLAALAAALESAERAGRRPAARWP